MKLEHALTQYTKINSKWLKDLNRRPDTIKLRAENTGKTSFDTNHTKVLLGWSPKAIEIKAKINKWDLIKFTTFCIAKETITINKTKRTYGLGKKVCKWCDWQGLNLQNLQTAHASRASLVAQTVKRWPTMWETWVQSLGWEDPLEKEMATHSSTLAWKIPWTEEPGRLQSTGLQRTGHDWVTSLSTSCSSI